MWSQPSRSAEYDRALVVLLIQIQRRRRRPNLVALIDDIWVWSWSWHRRMDNDLLEKRHAELISAPMTVTMCSAWSLADQIAGRWRRTKLCFSYRRKKYRRWEFFTLPSSPQKFLGRRLPFFYLKKYLYFSSHK